MDLGPTICMLSTGPTRRDRTLSADQRKRTGHDTTTQLQLRDAGPIQLSVREESQRLSLPAAFEGAIVRPVKERFERGPMIRNDVAEQIARTGQKVRDTRGLAEEVAVIIIRADADVVGVVKGATPCRFNGCFARGEDRKGVHSVSRHCGR